MPNKKPAKKNNGFSKQKQKKVKMNDVIKIVTYDVPLATILTYTTTTYSNFSLLLIFSKLGYFFYSHNRTKSSTKLVTTTDFHKHDPTIYACIL